MKILDKLTQDLNKIDTTIRIGGIRGTASLFQEAARPAHRYQQCMATPATGRPCNAACDVLVIRRAGPQHAKGDCQFNHDISKAVALRVDKAERSKIELSAAGAARASTL